MNLYFVLNLSGTLNCEIRRVSRNQMLYWKNAQWEIRFRFLSLETRKLFAEQCILHEISRDILRTNLLFIVPSKRLHHRAHNVPFTSAWMCSSSFLHICSSFILPRDICRGHQPVMEARELASMHGLLSDCYASQSGLAWLASKGEPVFILDDQGRLAA